MTPATEFPKLLDLAFAESQAATRELFDRHQLATFPNWSLDMENGQLVFHHLSGKNFTATIQIVGTLTHSTWEWAWASLEWPSPLTLAAAAARGWGATNEMPILTEPRTTLDELTAWKLTAFTARHYGWSAIYRGQSDRDRLIFLTFQVPPL